MCMTTLLNIISISMVDDVSPCESIVVFGKVCLSRELYVSQVLDCICCQATVKTIPPFQLTCNQGDMRTQLFKCHLLMLDRKTSMSTVYVLVSIAHEISGHENVSTFVCNGLDQHAPWQTHALDTRYRHNKVMLIYSMLTEPNKVTFHSTVCC